MKEISFPATILKSQDKGIAKLLIDDPWEEIIRNFAIANKIKPGSKMRVVFQEWSDDCSERAFNLFHALRDRLAEAQEDTSNAYKEHLKQCLKYDYGVKKELFTGTYWLKSTTKYTTREMYNLIQRTIDRCVEEGAVIEDLLPEFQEIKEEWKDADRRRKAEKENVS